MDWGDLLALEVYQQIQRHGWDLVATLRPLNLTEREAEALLIRLDWLTEHLPPMLAAFYGHTQEPAHGRTTPTGNTR